MIVEYGPFKGQHISNISFKELINIIYSYDRGYSRELRLEIFFLLNRNSQQYELSYAQYIIDSIFPIANFTRSKSVLKHKKEVNN